MARTITVTAKPRRLWVVKAAAPAVRLLPDRLARRLACWAASRVKVDVYANGRKSDTLSISAVPRV